MSDIVERLRERAEQEFEMLGDIHLPLLEAAAEIERLRAALRDIKEHSLELYATGVARAALTAPSGAMEERT